LPVSQLAVTIDNRQSTVDNPVILLGGTTATEAPPDVEEEHAKDWPIPRDVLHDKLAKPCQGRPYYIRYAFKMGWTLEQVHELTRIDPWFLEQMRELVEGEPSLSSGNGRRALAKQAGYSNVQLAHAAGSSPTEIASELRDGKATPSYKLVDTCAAEFEARTPYYYSSHERAVFQLSDVASHGLRPTGQDEIRVTDRPRVVILGGGPNRIGQGIEFDYCCCHAAFAAKKAGFESVMVNSNPETVSTDFDTSDLLFFEPLTHEDVLNIVERLNQPSEFPISNFQFPIGETNSSIGNRQSAIGNPLVRGVIVQFGGQTPLNLAQGLKDAGVPILGTQPEMIDLAEDREEFQKLLRELSLLQPPSGIVRTRAEAKAVARKLAYPVLV